MKFINRDEYGTTINFSKHCFLTTIFEWNQFDMSGRWNWITFTPFKLELENEKMTGGATLEFIFMGLGFRIRWNHTPEILDAMSKPEDLDSALPWGLWIPDKNDLCDQRFGQFISNALLMGNLGTEALFNMENEMLQKLISAYYKKVRPPLVKPYTKEELDIRVNL